MLIDTAIRAHHEKQRCGQCQMRRHGAVFIVRVRTERLQIVFELECFAMGFEIGIPNLEGRLKNGERLLFNGLHLAIDQHGVIHVAENA